MRLKWRKNSFVLVFFFHTPETMLYTTRDDLSACLKKSSPVAILWVTFLLISFEYCCNFPTVALFKSCPWMCQMHSRRENISFSDTWTQEAVISPICLGLISSIKQLQYKQNSPLTNSILYSLNYTRVWMHLKFHIKKGLHSRSLKCFSYIHQTTMSRRSL